MEFRDRDGDPDLKFTTIPDYVLWFTAYKENQPIHNTIDLDTLENRYGAAEGADAGVAAKKAFLDNVAEILELAELAMEQKQLNGRQGANITASWVEAQWPRR